MKLPNSKLPVVNVLDLIKAQVYEIDDAFIISAYPAVGSLHISKNNLGYISGYVRTRGKDNGRYPYNYLEMIASVFGYESNTIEICSHSVSNKDCFTVDINPEYNPSCVDDGQTLSKLESNIYNRARLDPPYSEKAAKEMYGTSLPDVGKLLKAAARVVKPKSLIFLLLGNVNRQACPAQLKRIGHITISVIPNNESRALHIYYKLPIKGKFELEALEYQLPEIRLRSPKFPTEVIEDDTCNVILDKRSASDSSSDIQAAGGDEK